MSAYMTHSPTSDYWLGDYVEIGFSDVLTGAEVPSATLRCTGTVHEDDLIKANDATYEEFMDCQPL